MSDRDRPNLTAMDIQALNSVPPIQVEMDAGAAFELLAVLQLASRHPVAIKSRTMQRTILLAKVLEKHLSVTPNLARLCAAGWDRDFDEPRISDAPLILPGR